MPLDRLQVRELADAANLASDAALCLREAVLNNALPQVAVGHLRQLRARVADVARRLEDLPAVPEPDGDSATDVTIYDKYGQPHVIGTIDSETGVARINNPNIASAIKAGIGWPFLRLVDDDNAPGAA